MTHLGTWIWLIVAIVTYRLLFNTATPIIEHVAGMYYAGVALLVHWLLCWYIAARRKAVAQTTDAKAGEAC